MLKWLRVKNLALVDELELEFGEDFNVITGETGAGKSVLMGAIGMLLGARADKSSIRSGADRCEINAIIGLPKKLAPAVQKILDEASIEGSDGETGELQLRRVISPSGARNFVNDSSVGLQTLRDIGDLLIDIHGANEHQSLLKPSLQLELVDRYGKLEKEVASCAALWKEQRQLEKELDELSSKLPSNAEAEQLTRLAEEIDKAAPEPGEDASLSTRHAVAANARQILDVAGRASAALAGREGSVDDQLASCYRILHELERLDAASAAEFSSRCESVTSAVRELSSDLEDYASKVELDEEEFARLEERLRVLQTLKRRYGPTLEDVLAARTSAQERLALHENAAEARTALSRRADEAASKLATQAKKLSAARQRAAAAMIKEVVSELKKLGFLKAAFEIAFNGVEPGPSGADRIEFMFCANPGEALQPLRNVASSGEMSRVMLALKTVLAEADAVPILVFDEIDVNIGGETAVKVGEALKKLGRSHQVLCISHLPRVAALASSHFLVEKKVRQNRSFTTVSPLDEDGRLDEITRMLGGGKAARSHAEELLHP